MASDLESTSLVDPSFSKSACGIGLVLDLPSSSGGAAPEASTTTTQLALRLLSGLSHRGALGSDHQTSDGAGALFSIPDSFFRERFGKLGLPLPGGYAIGCFFFSENLSESFTERAQVEQELAQGGFQVLGWRPVPVVSSVIGPIGLEGMPSIHQAVVVPEISYGGCNWDLYLSRRRIEKRLGSKAVVSLSFETLVYKGLCRPEELGVFFPDLLDPNFKTSMALIHSRFSTNTAPSWELAHPFKALCHNGEINTIRGNRNRLYSREKEWSKGGVDAACFPLVNSGQSDSASLDAVLEFFLLSGMHPLEALRTLVPPAWEAEDTLSAGLQSFFEARSVAMEPWDGPAAIGFAHGDWAGATTDRNGLRPCRYWIEADGEDFTHRRLILASEAGALDTPPERILKRGRLGPGECLLFNRRSGELILPHQERAFLEKIIAPSPGMRSLGDGVFSEGRGNPEHCITPYDLHYFNVTEEELDKVIRPLAEAGEEAISSMGADTPLAVLSEEPRLLHHFLKQNFAQVTNPPIDPLREARVMSLRTVLGPRISLFASEEKNRLPEMRWKLKSPIITPEVWDELPAFEISLAFNEDTSLIEALDHLEKEALEAVKRGAPLVALSDCVEGGLAENQLSIPPLLAVGCLHQALIREGLRNQVSLVVRSAEARDSHSVATLFGVGAEAVCPWLLWEVGCTFDPIKIQRVRLALEKGLLKVLSKMGISVLASYVGSQLFEALGVGSEVMKRAFPQMTSRLGGIGFSDLESQLRVRRGHALTQKKSPQFALPYGGQIHFRSKGEQHAWTPSTIALLQRAAREKNPESYKEYSKLANREGMSPLALRNLLDFKSAPKVEDHPVEPAASIVKRFTTGAMSLGAISTEAHTTLANGMNRLHARSNSGEGGEDPARFIPWGERDSTNSAIKQVASARFGVTLQYLGQAKELQIKIAQGAKPGEGGQLPAHKVDSEIARLRHSTPGIQLISPPPHHDIYSIEDLGQLIFDLRQANSFAEISVKLVAQAGVGQVAVGVAKAGADKIVISGDNGGTGASPLSSIQNAGIPWEMGIAEAHQALTQSGFRGWVRLETDGGLRTGRDVVIAACLGADEFGFATVPLVAMGCTMMRKCHLNTCPVGIATQDPELRKRFTGAPEALINTLFFIAEEVRTLLQELGLSNLAEAVGRADLLQSKTTLLDLRALLRKVPARPKERRASHRDSRRFSRFNDSLFWPQGGFQKIRNSDRSIGTHLSQEAQQKYGNGLPPEGVRELRLKGSAGQSFGAFLHPALELLLEGEANDGVGKGLSGGKLVVRAPVEWRKTAGDYALIGNAALYGATSGSLYCGGRAGERFAVRNSGATAVVEGVGDHGCEYMTGGIVLILGKTGQNFGAGMSGGLALVYDDDGLLESRCNRDSVTLRPLSEKEAGLILPLLRAHLENTLSERAQLLLSRWNGLRSRIVAVVPREKGETKVIPVSTLREVIHA